MGQRMGNFIQGRPSNYKNGPEERPSEQESNDVGGGDKKRFPTFAIIPVRVDVEPDVGCPRDPDVAGV